jgi:hypothetical protein
MRSQQHSQRDLFEEEAPLPPLRAELRAKLSPLLQVLLTEAAGIGAQDAATRSNGQEDGDDQDHA